MLKVENLSLQIGGKTILSQVTMDMVAGELLTVLGPNGAGKSTLLKCLSGDIQSVANLVMLNHQILSDYSPSQLSIIRSVMPQTVYLDFPFLVSEVIEMALSSKIHHSKRKELAYESLKRFDVEHLIDRNYLTLSGGEQQRVQLSRVVGQLLSKEAAQPRYLFLDECTSSLDLAHQHQVFRVLKDLIREYDLSVLVVLHDLNLASQYSDRLLLMKEGEIVRLDKVDEVLVEELIEDVYGFKSQVINHPQGWPVVLPA